MSLSSAVLEQTSAPAALPFEQLYDAYVDAVWRNLARLGVEPAHIEDAAQEVFVTAWKRFDSFAGRSSVKTWLIGICLNVAARHRRSDGRRRAREELASVGSAAPAPDEVLRLKESVAQLQEVLGALSDEQREVFVMMEMEELSAPEVSALLELPLNTVYSRLRLARAAFNARIEKLEKPDG